MSSVHLLSPLFPEGKSKALTFSYDDGLVLDERLVTLFKKHALKGTFNINAGRIVTDGKDQEPESRMRLTASGVLDVYEKNGMEVAIHGWKHPFLEKLSLPQATYEILNDRLTLEKLLGHMVRGMAFPFGTYSDGVLQVMKDCGIVYSRTTKQTERFKIPENFLLWDSTCHHNNPRLFELADTFLSETSRYREPRLFYVWGHAFEFDDNNNWDVIERFCEKVSGQDDVWYATNLEICDYITAYRALVFSPDSRMVWNPTATTVWFRFADADYVVKPGETLTLAI